MKNNKESLSKWQPVTDLMEGIKPLSLGPYAAYWYHKSPRRLLHALSYYKFAAKMIGQKKRVLDVGCNEGLGSWLFAKECGFCKGVDFDAEALEVAKQNFQDPSITFAHEDFLHSSPTPSWDAVVSFDVIEHIYPQNAGRFLSLIGAHLKPHGVAVIGTPSEISQQFASPISKRGHVNVYSHERLKEELQKVFKQVFLFAANDEVIHTGFLPLAHYYIAIGCGKNSS